MYAWFTMNKSVDVTGMEMKTVVDSNLQIDKAAPTNGGSWGAGSFATNDSTFANSIVEPITDAVLVSYAESFECNGNRRIYFR